MPATQTPDQLIEDTYQSMLADLTPIGSVEQMFALKIARYTVLSEMATKQVLALDMAAEDYFKKFRQLSQLLASYERTMKFAYTELRRLQTERAVAVPGADIFTMPRLARTAILTSANRVAQQGPLNQTDQKLSRKSAIGEPAVGQAA